MDVSGSNIPQKGPFPRLVGNTIQSIVKVAQCSPALRPEPPTGSYQAAISRAAHNNMYSRASEHSSCGLIRYLVLLCYNIR